MTKPTQAATDGDAGVEEQPLGGVRAEPAPERRWEILVSRSSLTTFEVDRDGRALEVCGPGSRRDGDRPGPLAPIEVCVESTLR